MKEGVVSKNKEERGERTALFDASLDVYQIEGASSKEGRHFDVAQGTTNKKPKPSWKLGVIEDLMNPSMVNGVKGLGSVEKKKKAVDFFLNASVEVGV